MDSEPLSNAATHRETAESKSGNPKRIGEAEHIAPQLFHGVLTRRSVGGAVTTGVVTKDAKIGQEIRHLRGPHAVISSEGVGKDEHRAALDAFNAVENARVVDDCK